MNDDVRAAELRYLKLAAAMENGIPKEHAFRLVGEDANAINEDAKRFAADIEKARTAARGAPTVDLNVEIRRAADGDAAALRRIGIDPNSRR